MERQPLYCEDCNEVHMLLPVEVERIVYTLVGQDIDHRLDPNDEKEDRATAMCLLAWLAWSRDGEMYGEYVEANIESREAMQPVECLNHNDEEGPHHAPLCHYFDDDPMLPDAAIERRDDGELVIYTGWATNDADPDGPLVDWCDNCDSGNDLAPEFTCPHCGRAAPPSGDSQTQG